MRKLTNGVTLVGIYRGPRNLAVDSKNRPRNAIRGQSCDIGQSEAVNSRFLRIVLRALRVIVCLEVKDSIPATRRRERIELAACLSFNMR